MGLSKVSSTEFSATPLSETPKNRFQPLTFANHYIQELGNAVTSLFHRLFSVIIPPPIDKSSTIDSNWDSARNQRIEICLSSDKFENPDVDVKIRTLFASTQLARKFLRYELDGEFFNVLLIHNPNKLNLKSALSVKTPKHGLVNSTLNYNKKIGIFVNKKAPQKLIDHISTLHHLSSWWDRWWNISICNGTRALLQHTTTHFNLFGDLVLTTHTYPVCSYYKAMKKAEP